MSRRINYNHPVYSQVPGPPLLRSRAVPRKYFRKYIPHHDTVRNHKYLRHFQPLLRHPNLWHLNRHSVAGGVAAGMIGGFIPAPIQMLVAAILAIIFRVNLPVAVATTLLSNPFTWPPFIVGAVAIGTFITGEAENGFRHFEFDWMQGDWALLLPELSQWFLGLGKAYLIGNGILAVLLAALSYLLVQIGWRLYIVAYLRRRRLRQKKQGPA